MYNVRVHQLLVIGAFLQLIVNNKINNALGLLVKLTEHAYLRLTSMLKLQCACLLLFVLVTVRDSG